MIEVAQAASLEALLEARGDPMAVCSERDWLRSFLDIPEDASAPLAMSGPHPRAVGSYGAECIAWAKAELGITLRWWQALAVTRQLEHDEAGALVWREIVETGPRRIGKSVRLRVVALWRLSVAHRIGETQLAMLVSKDLAVGKEIHRGAWRWAESKDWKVTRLNGGQEVEAPDESRWLLRADTAVYGYDVGYGQVDESWGVDPQSITDGLEPALLERLWSQLHLTSTAHVKATSLMRRRLVAALRNADQDVLLLMWGAPPGADYADEATWRAASPHWSKDRRDLMARKYGAALAGQDEPEFDDPDPVRGWAAQYLNVWPLLFASDHGRIFPRWDDLATKPSSEKPAALGVASNVSRNGYFLGAATSSGFVNVVTPAAFKEPRVGVRDLEMFVSEVARISKEHDIAVGIQVKGPAWHLKTAIEDAGGRVEPVDFDGFVQACVDWERAIDADGLQHAGSAELDKAVAAAQWRTVNDRLVISRKSGDISALESVLIARYVTSTVPDYDVLDSIF